MTQTLAIVGAGRVGRALGRRLHELGWQIGAVVTRSNVSARAAVRAIGAGMPFGRLTSRVMAADVVLISTPDSAIHSTATALAELCRQGCLGKIVLHTSGALDSSELAPLARAGAGTGSLHPMQTFSGRRPPDLEGSIFAVEGGARALKAARRICRQLGGVAVRLTAASKPAYHAAGSLASPHILTLIEFATRLWMSLGFTRRQAVGALLTLTRQTLDNFESLGPNAAWTGPLSRADYATIRLHVQALPNYPAEYRDAYEAITRLAVEVLAGGSLTVRSQLERVLSRRRKEDIIVPELGDPNGRVEPRAGGAKLLTDQFRIPRGNP